MRIVKTICRDKWPKLAWVAQLDGCKITIEHGPSVEVSDDWLFSGTWDGDFSDGSFDVCENTVGTGLRVRYGNAILVPSSNTAERLFYVQEEKSSKVAISNHLPALLALTNLELLPSENYPEIMMSFKDGLSKAAKVIPTNKQDIKILYYNLLSWDGQALAEESRQCSAPSFESYSEYRSYLDNVSVSVLDNIRSPDRKNKISTIATTLSSGYDSTAVSAIVKSGGVDLAYTINKRIAFAPNDSGIQVGKDLDLKVVECDIQYATMLDHQYFWASQGTVTDMNMTAFPDVCDLSCIFTGIHGDICWGFDYLDADLADLVRETGCAESYTYLLEKGIIQCAPVFWGASQIESIQRVSSLEEMKPWTLGNDYDRPIARRIAEEAGVQRSAFGWKKKSTIVFMAACYPNDINLVAQLNDYLVSRGKPEYSKLRSKLSVLLQVFEIFSSRLGYRIKTNSQSYLPEASDLFYFANTLLAKKIRETKLTKN